MLRRIRSESIQLLYFGTLGFVNDTCGSWDRLLILYIYIFENLVVISFQVDIRNILYWVVVIRSVFTNMMLCEVGSYKF